MAARRADPRPERSVLDSSRLHRLVPPLRQLHDAASDIVMRADELLHNGKLDERLVRTRARILIDTTPGRILSALAELEAAMRRTL